MACEPNFGELEIWSLTLILYTHQIVTQNFVLSCFVEYRFPYFFTIDLENNKLDVKR